MPAKSQAQRRWAFGVMGEAWAKAHHMDNAGKLPARAKAVKKKKGKAKARKAKKKTTGKRRGGYAAAY